MEHKEKFQIVLEKLIVDQAVTIESLEKDIDQLEDENDRLKEDRAVCERTIRSLTARLERGQYDTYPA